MFRLITIVIIYSTIIFPTKLYGQEDDYDDPTWRDNVFFGLHIGWVSRSETFLEIIPVAGYRITDFWQAGIGLKYEYYRSTGAYTGRTSNTYSASIYGGTLFTDVEFLKNMPAKGMSFFVHAEPELLNLPKYFKDTTGTSRFFHTSFVTGIGIRQKAGKRASFNMMVLWAFNKTSPSSYPNNPFLRFGLIF